MCRAGDRVGSRFAERGDSARHATNAVVVPSKRSNFVLGERPEDVLPVVGFSLRDGLVMQDRSVADALDTRRLPRRQRHRAMAISTCLVAGSVDVALWLPRIPVLSRRRTSRAKLGHVSGKLHRGQDLRRDASVLPHPGVVGEPPPVVAGNAVLVMLACGRARPTPANRTAATSASSR